jgi:ribulose-phosphate 3-epimerase
MDMHFVPNLTFGPKLIKDIKKHTNIPFDIHLMVDNPDIWIPLIKDYADIITIHYESCVHIHKTIQEIKKSGKKVGIALNPSTNEDVLKYLIDDIDLILVMTVNPGFGGQSFIESQLEKIKNIKKIIGNKDIIIEVDGGINDKTAKLCIDNGANMLVAGSFIFNHKNYEEAIKILKN